MDVIRGCVIPVLTISMVLPFVVVHAKSVNTCKPVALEDIQDAGSCSADVYNSWIGEGKRVTAASNYIIEKIIRSWTEPLRVMITRKVSATPPTTMICFMGTNSAKQLLKQFHAGAFKEKVSVMFGGKYVKVNRYFWRAFQTLIEVTTAVKISDKTKYIVTGHSLGGALASLFSIYMTDKHGGAIWKNPDSSLITFGQPRVGDSDYAHLHDLLIEPFRKPRIVNNEDIVPHIPFKSRGIFHSRDYEHTSREIWIQKKTTRTFYWSKCGWIKCPNYHVSKKLIWHVCPDGDGNACSNGISKIKLDAIDHIPLKYTDAIVDLIRNTQQANKFIHDQCK